MASQARGVTQQWVDEQVAEAKADNEPGLYSRVQASRHPRMLYRRWKRLNAVLGAETGDTWLSAICWGVGVGFPLWVLLAWLGWDRVGWPGALGGGLLVGAVGGALTGFSKWIRAVWEETYIESVTSEYHSVLSVDSDVTDAVVAFLQRLPFYHRPDVFEGTGGQTGFKDKKAIVRLKTEFGQSVLDMRDSTDYYDLPGDASELVATTAIIRFALIKLVREAGTLYRRFSVPPPKAHWSKQLSTVWPWLTAGSFFLGAVLVSAN